MATTYTDITKTGEQSYRTIRNDIDNPYREYNFDKILPPSLSSYSPLDTYGALLEPRETSLEELGINPDFGSSRYDVTENASWGDLADYENLRGERQSGLAKLGAGITKGVILAGTTAVDGTLGLVYGIGQAIVEGRISALFDNDISNALHAINQWSEKNLPNYRTEAEQNVMWYQNLGTMNFWADTFLKNMGFTVGAMLSGGVWTAPLKALKVGAMAARVLGSFMQGVNEGRVEANNLYHETVEAANKAARSSYEDYIRGFIDDPSISNSEKLEKAAEAQKNLQKIEEINRQQALDAGCVDLAVNSVLLPASDYITWGRLYTRGFKNAQRGVKNRVRQSVGERILEQEGRLGSVVEDASGMYGILEGKPALRGAAKGVVKGATEMNEEMWQEMGSQTSTNIFMPDSPDAYYEALQDPESLRLANNFWESAGKGFINSYGSGEQWEQGFVGFLTGALGVPTFGRMNNMGHDVAIGRGKPVALSSGIIGEIRQAKYEQQQAEKYVPLMNNLVEKIRKNRDYLAQSNAFQDAMDGFVRENNQFEYQNASDNDIFAGISAFAQTGRMNDLKELLSEDFENMSQEELQKLALYTAKNPNIDAEGNVLKTDTEGNTLTGPYVRDDGTLYTATAEGTEEMRKSLIKQRDELLKKVEQYEESQSKVRAIGHDALTEDQVNELAWMDWKVGVLEERYESLKEKQLEFINTLRNSLNDFIQLNAEEIVSDEELISSPGRQPGESIDEYKERLKKRNKARQRTLDISSKEGQIMLKNLQTILEYLDALRNSETALKMSSIIESNPELLEYMKNDIYGNSLLEQISGIDHISFQKNLKDIEDLGNIAKAARNFQDTLKDFIEHPINQIKHRNKIKEKVQNAINDRKSKRNKNIADSIARRIDFDGDTMSIAKALQDNAEDIEKVGGIDAWLENLTDDQKAKVRKAQTLQKGVNSLKDQIDNSEEIDEDRVKRLAKQFIDEAAQGASTIEEIEKKVSKLLNEDTLDNKIRQNARDFNDLEIEKTIAETKQALKGIFDDSFERIKKDVAEMNKIDEAKAAEEKKRKKERDKLEEKEEDVKKKVPKEQKPKPPTENSPRVPPEPETSVSQEPGEAKRQMRETNDKISQALEKPNPKEYNRPQVTEAYLHGYDKESYIEYITKHPSAIPTLKGATRQQYIKAVQAIHTYLKKHNAFDYIKEGLKVGETVEFFIDEELNQQAGTFVVLMRARDKQGNTHIIGSMPTEIDFNSVTKIAIEDEEGNPTGEYVEDEDGKTLAQRNPERYKLFQDIKKQYEEDSEKSTDKSYFTTKVEQLMGGSLPRSNKESSVASIFENTGHSPIIAIVDQNGTIKSGNEDIDKHIIGSDFQDEGQVYVLIRANNGSYVPALTYSSYLIDLVDNADDWYINQILDKLQKATTELNVPNSTYEQELYKWLRLSGLSAKFKYREKNQWVNDTSKNIENATHLVLNFDDEQGNHKTVSIPFTGKEISRENALKGLKEAVGLSKNVRTNVIIGELNSSHRDEYIKNISNYLHTNIIKGETHTINDWFTYEYSGEKPNRQRMKNEGQREAGKTKVTKDPVTVNVDGKNYTVEGDYVTRDDGSLVEVGTEEYERVMNPQNTTEKGDTVGGSPVALSYLLDSGPGTIVNTPYLLHAISAAFTNITDDLEAIRAKYLGLVDQNPSNFAKDTTGALQEVRGLIEKTYGQEGVDILNLILDNATGFPIKQGREISKRLDALTSMEQPKPTSQLLADTLSAMSDTKPKTKPAVKKKARKFLKVEDTTDTATTQEQIQRDIENVKRMFPELSKEGRVRLVHGIIRTIDENGNPVEAYAEFREGILYISDVSPKGSAFHESFHYIVDMLLDKAETEEMFKEAEIEFKTNDREALEEQLAERFRDYMNGMTDPSIKGVIKRFFAKLKHIIDSIKGNTNYLDNFFYSIYSKKMITKNSSNNQSSMQTNTVEMQQIKDQAITDGTFMKAPKGLHIEQDNKSYYRGQYEEPIIDKNGNLILRGRKDSLYERAGYNIEKGVSATVNMQLADEYGGNQEYAYRANVEEKYGEFDQSWEKEQELNEIEEHGYYLIQFPKNISNQIINENDEIKIVGDVVIPKGQYIIEHISNNGRETIATADNNASKVVDENDEPNIDTFSRENNDIYDFKEALLDYKYRKTDYSNLDEATKNSLKGRGITEEEYQALNAEQREYLLHCM